MSYESASFNLSEKDVFAAEQARVRGDLNGSWSLLFPPGQHESSLSDRALFSDEDRKLFMMAGRIAANVQMSWAKRSWLAQTVADHLKLAKNQISIYHGGTVRHFAQRLNTDTRGTPYEFWAEMARDEAEYLITLRRLTERREFLQMAAVKLNQVAADSQEPTSKTLAQFRADQLGYWLEPSRGSFRIITLSFERAVEASLHAKNYERTAAIAAWYAVEASQSQDRLEERRARRVFEGVARENPALKKIMGKTFFQATVEPYRNFIWQNTGGRGYAKELALPLT